MHRVYMNTQRPLNICFQAIPASSECDAYSSNRPESKLARKRDSVYFSFGFQPAPALRFSRYTGYTGYTGYTFVHNGR